MPRICQLDPHVVNKIAAGEVIERPASVVKELLENSTDALATRIEVDVAQGGCELIRVVDNGEGIHPDDMLLAVTSHATSKIRSADDLFRVQTLGFRGEALASIASVSRLRIRSRTPDAPTGCEIEVDAGHFGPLQECGCPAGAMVEIRQLFANTPVRRKFLKSPATEFAHISEQFTRVMLPNPRLHAVLRHNGKSVYDLPATDRITDRLQLFYGSQVVENLIRVESESNGVRLWGYVGHPSQSKSTRKGQYLFLNGRWIQDRSLQHALGEAYRGLLMVGRYPIGFLFLEMPPDAVDVNVHPTKAEVRFRDSQQLYRQLLSALRTKFLGLDLESSISVPSRIGAASMSTAVVAPERQRELQTDLASWAKERLANWSPTEQIGAPSVFDPQDEEIADFADTLMRRQDAQGLDLPVSASATDDWPPTGQNEIAGHVGAIADDDVSDALGEWTDPALRKDDAQPPAEVRPNTQGFRVMQIHDCYLVVETEQGLTVIDQHALHERVLYEQLRRRVLEGRVESQRMLVPETLELGPAEAAAMVENRELLQELGFGIEEFGGSTVLLTGYPPMLARADLGQLIRDIGEQLCETGKKPTRRDILDKILHMMSCKAAIKAGQRLTSTEMESLLTQRHLIDDAHHCPHGRPTALVLSRSELDRQFGRLG